MEIQRIFSGIELKFYELCTKIVEAEGLKIYDLNYVAGSSTLRLFIFNPQTKTAQIDECVRVDRAFSPFAEELEWIPESLILEVSSPGVFRELASLEHFQWVNGERIKLTVGKPISDEQFPQAPKSLKGSKKVIGILRQVDADSIVVEVEGISLSFSFEQIRKANLEPEI